MQQLSLCILEQRGRLRQVDLDTWDKFSKIVGQLSVCHRDHSIPSFSFVYDLITAAS